MTLRVRVRSGCERSLGGNMSEEQLKELEEADIADLKKVLNLYRMIQGWCRVNRWLAMAIIGLAIAIAQFGESIKHIIGWKN